MLILGEPQHTNYDLNFNLGGIPVRVHPMFWLIALLFGATGQQPDPHEVLIWVFSLFVSILIHEFGHAIAAGWYGWPASIVLYGMGGLAMYRPTYRKPSAQIVISAAGPAAGFLLAAAVMAALVFNGIAFGIPGLFFIDGDQIANDLGRILVIDLLFINIFWGIVNLFPVLPLDGSHIARELLIMAWPMRAITISLWLSTLSGAALAAIGLLLHSPFMIILFGVLAFQSFQLLRESRGRYGGRPW